jgi:hypothetical protein
VVPAVSWGAALESWMMWFRQVMASSAWCSRMVSTFIDNMLSEISRWQVHNRQPILDVGNPRCVPDAAFGWPSRSLHIVGPQCRVWRRLDFLAAVPALKDTQGTQQAHVGWAVVAHIGVLEGPAQRQAVREGRDIQTVWCPSYVCSRVHKRTLCRRLCPR